MILVIMSRIQYTNTYIFGCFSSGSSILVFFSETIFVGLIFKYSLI